MRLADDADKQAKRASARVSARPAVLVAVGGSARAIRAVDTAAQLAHALDASWHAIFIETPRSGADTGVVDSAGEALAYAAQLGATVSREPAASVANGLIAHLASARAGHLVIGVPSALSRRVGAGGSTLRDVLARCPDLTVHLAPAGAPAERAGRMRSVPGGPRAPFRHYAISLLLVMATVAVCELLRQVTGGRPLSLLFLFPVIAAAARFGLGPSLASVVASVFAFDLFLLAPRLHLEPLAPVNLLLWVSLGAVAIYTSAITGALRSRVALSDRSAQESARIVTFAQTLTRMSSWSETAQAVCDEFAAVMDAQALLFRQEDGRLVCAAAQPADARLGPIDRGALDWCWAQGLEAGTGTTTIAAADWRFEPLQTSLGVLAVLALSRTDGRDPIRADRKVLFATLAGQAALAHERLVLEDRARSRPDE